MKKTFFTYMMACFGICILLMALSIVIGNFGSFICGAFSGIFAYATICFYLEYREIKDK